VIAAIAAAFEPDALARGFSKLVQHLRRDSHAAGVFQHGLRPFGIGLGPIAHGLEPVDAVLERGVANVGHAGFDGVIEALEAQIRFGGALV
jgi:hypothetical protein